MENMRYKQQLRMEISSLFQRDVMLERILIFLLVMLLEGLRQDYKWQQTKHPVCLDIRVPSRLDNPHTPVLQGCPSGAASTLDAFGTTIALRTLPW